MTTAVILAGGLGTRLRKVVADVPKPMAPINGRPFLEHLLDYWIGQGVTDFVLSVGYLCEQIIDHFGDRYRDRVIRYAIEETPLGTGGGVLLSLDQLPEPGAPFLLLNGDTFFEVELQDLQRYHRMNESAWTFSMFRAMELDRYMGMEVSGDGQITNLGSRLGTVGSLANGGVYMVAPEVLRDSPWRAGDKVSLEADLIPEALGRGVHFYGYECAGRFIDIGVAADYARAASLLGAS